MATSTISATSSIMLQHHEDTILDDHQQHASLATSIRLQPPTDENTEERLNQIDELKYFLGTATNDWDSNQQVKSFPLPTSESLSCVFWNDLFHVTGTDIVRTLLYRFHLFGRPVTNLKKFEEGIFSDLRNLKPGMDASLEEPKSEFLEMLYKNNCIRTQKKQKVFFWFSVPHDRLFLDALERDLKREKMGLEPTSVAVAEPATSLSLDTTQELFDQLRKSMSLSAVAATHAMDEVVLGGDLTCLTSANDLTEGDHSDPPISASSAHDLHFEKLGHRSTKSLSSIPNSILSPVQQTIPTSFDQPGCYSAGASPKSINFEELYPFFDNQEKQRIFGAFSLFEGSPTYKQRHRRRTLSFGQHEEDVANILSNPQQLFQQSNCQEGPEKIYTCPLPHCARIFKRLEHLKRHFRTHTMERPYSCNMCGKYFSRTDNLAQHKKTHNRSRATSTALSRCNSGSKLISKSPSSDDPSTKSFKSRKLAVSLRTQCNEIIEKLSVLASQDALALPPPPSNFHPPMALSNTTTAVGPVDYFSYQAGDMSRYASTASPTGSNPHSDEESLYANGNGELPSYSEKAIDHGGDICMSDDAALYDEESYDVFRPYIPTHYSPPQPEPTSSTTSSFMWSNNDVGPPCSTASSSSSLIHEDLPYRVSWYFSTEDKSPTRSSSTSSLYSNHYEIYSWQQT